MPVEGLKALLSAALMHHIGQTCTHAVAASLSHVVGDQCRLGCAVQHAPSPPACTCDRHPHTASCTSPLPPAAPFSLMPVPRYLYGEGMKLVKRYEEEEAELADKLKVGAAEGGGGTGAVG